MHRGGHTNLNAGGSILSQGGDQVRVIGNDIISLAAGGVIGTASNQIQTQLNNAGMLFLEARGEIDGLSANVNGNFTRASVQLLNNPPGLVLFNGIAFGGEPIHSYEQDMASLYTNPNPVNLAQYAQFDGRMAADFPAIFNMGRFAMAPTINISTVAIDGIPIMGLQFVPGMVPIPVPARPPVPAPEKPATSGLPAPSGGQLGPIESEEERPPQVVPLPGASVPSVNVEGVLVETSLTEESMGSGQSDSSTR